MNKMYVIYEVNSPEMVATGCPEFEIKGVSEKISVALQFVEKLEKENLDDGFETLERYETDEDIISILYKDGNEDSLLWTEIHIVDTALI